MLALPARPSVQLGPAPLGGPEAEPRHPVIKTYDQPRLRATAARTAVAIATPATNARTALMPRAGVTVDRNKVRNQMRKIEQARVMRLKPLETTRPAAPRVRVEL